MPQMKWVVRYVAYVALASMIGFVALGCGDDGAQPQDAGTHDAPAADTGTQEDAAVQQDAVTQQDVGPQEDAANPSGTVIITQVSPQPTGVPALDGVKLGSVSAGWSSLTPTGDNPTNFLDKRAGGLGCYAVYYKFDEVNDAGANIPKEGTANAGDVTVTGYTGGSYIVGMTDGGTPVTQPISATTTCTRTEIMAGDAGTGRFEYECDIMGNVPVTGFLETSDTVDVIATGGGLEVAAFNKPDLPVMPFAEVTDPGVLWNVTSLVKDAGLEFNYKCGPDTDAGAGACPAVIGILIESSDTTPTSGAPIANEPPTLEVGVIQCSALATGNSYSISKDLWDVAFPPGGNWKTIRTSVVHLSLTPVHSMSTLIGAGGGQWGLTVKP